MTNPLLQPDGRFKRSNVVGSDGSNRFADEEAVEKLPPRDDLLSAPSNTETPSYQPRYETAYPHRGQTLLALGATGFGMPWLLLLSLTDYILLGFAGAAVGVTISLAVLVMGYQELSGMTAGAVDPRGRDSALLGFRLALSGMFLGIGGTLLVLVFVINGFLAIQ